MKTIYIIGLAVVLGASAGCSKDDDSAVAERKIVDVDVDEDALRRERDEFLRDARDRMHDLESDLAALDKQLEEGADAVGDDIRTSMRQLERDKDELRRQMAAVSERGADEWASFKASTKSALDRLEHGYNAVLDRMKTEPGEE